MSLYLLFPFLALIQPFGTKGCMKTITTTTPPTPCATCPWESFYSFHNCMDDGGCTFIPPTNITFHDRFEGEFGCREEKMTCPGDSLVAISLNGNALFYPSWQQFVDETMFLKFICSSEGVWQFYTTDMETANVDYIYCYYRQCSLCPNLVNSPDVEYDPVQPINSTLCRKMVVDCEPGFNNAQFTYADGSLHTFPIPTPEIKCSENARWTVQDQVFTSLTCVP